jgi:hypothetical protein
MVGVGLFVKAGTQWKVYYIVQEVIVLSAYI